MKLKKKLKELYDYEAQAHHLTDGSVARRRYDSPNNYEIFSIGRNYKKDASEEFQQDLIRNIMRSNQVRAKEVSSLRVDPKVVNLVNVRIIN